ncbi:hypothetical protein VTH06DRAFT_1461 [Thermothelomyces fergusii]
MAPRREVLDSEDDGSDFDDASEPEPAEQHEIEIAGEEPRKVVGASVSGQRPEIGNPFLSSVADPTPKDGESARGGTTAAAAAGNVDPPETIDLTNVTTPRKGAASETSDVWDVPSSADSRRAARTRGKRNAARPSLDREPERSAPPSDTQDPYAFPDATPPRKRSRRGTSPGSARQPPASSPVSLVPTATETLPSADGRDRSSAKKKKQKREKEETGSDGPGSTLPDTAPPSLYVAQSTLTASQKREYRVVDLSSEAIPEVSGGAGAHGDFSAAQSSPGAGEMYRSSMATTIAYPTPSRVALQWQLPETPGEASDDCASPGYEFGYQQSSPDVLTDMASTTDAPSSRRGKAKEVSSTGPGLSGREPPSSARRAKKRKVAREIEENGSQEPDPLGATTREEMDAPRQAADTQRDLEDLSYIAAKSGRKADDEDFVPEADRTDAKVMEKQEPTPIPAAKGKRGRKEKSSKRQPAAAEPDEPGQPGVVAPAETPPEAAAAEAEPTETAEPPAKRKKRGRPRKSEAGKPPAERESEEQIAKQQQQQPKTDAGPEQPEEARITPQPLAEAGGHHNSQPGPEVAAARDGSGDAVGKTASEEKENKAAAAEKAAEKETKQAAKDTLIRPAPPKVPYRVGLSKRTRIAPLLKSLKKPA